MVNAAYSAPSYTPEPSSPSTQELAAAGHFRAIALWLNQPLASQGIYVQVQPDRPGCLLLMVEFEQPPLRERLTRFLCHRIWLLNSVLIEGVHIVARPAGQRRILWQQRVRIVTPALRSRQRPAAAAEAGGSPLPPRLQQGRTAGQRASADSAIANTGNRLKTLRAFVLTGSAVAAFIFGCLVEVILSGSSPMLPTFTQQGSNRLAAQPGSRDRFAAQPAAGDAATPVRYEVPGRASTPPALRTGIVDAATEPVAVIQHAATPLDPDKVTLLFGGDISLDEIVYDEAGQAEAVFAGLEDYQKADLAMVNLASSLATAATSLEEEFYNRTRPDAIEVLKAGGVDIVNLTNEGTMEFGGEGLGETLETLDREGLYRLGAGRNELEARRPEIIDVKGKRIAYLSYAQGGDSAAHGDRPGINAQGMPRIVEDIRALRDEVDWIVVNYRWQTDIPAVPADWQTNLARMAIEQGADLVVGYHPQTLQGAEIYKGRPIAYSLGDFIFQPPTAEPAAGSKTPLDQDTAVLKVSLRDNQMKVEFVPVQVRDARPTLATGQEADSILTKLEQASAAFEKPMKASVVLELKGAPPTELPPNQRRPLISPQPAPSFVDSASPVAPGATPPGATPAAVEASPSTLPAPGLQSEPAAETLSPSPSLLPATPAETPEVFSTEPTPEADRVPHGSELDPPDLEAAPELDSWGPKASPNQPEFAPVPEEADRDLEPSPDGRSEDHDDRSPSGGYDSSPNRSDDSSNGSYSEPDSGTSSYESAPSQRLERGSYAPRPQGGAPAQPGMTTGVGDGPIPIDSFEPAQQERLLPARDRSAPPVPSGSDFSPGPQAGSQPAAVDEAVLPEPAQSIDGPALTPALVPPAPGIDAFSEPLVGPLSLVDPALQQPDS